MAKTTFSTSDNLTRKAWGEKLFRDTLKVSYFEKFMSEGSDSFVQTKSVLTKESGDAITFGIRMRLAGDAKNSGETLEGNEEALTTYDDSVSLEEYAHAVRDAGPLDRQRAAFSIDTESRQALLDWGAELIDELCFDALTVSPTKIFYGGDATATGDIDASDKLTPALISKARAWAMTGGGRSQTPLRPVRIQGKKYFVLLVHPDVMYDLKQDATFAQARREAAERGKKNPVFSGAEAVWDGVIIHEHENIPIVSNWGAGTDVAGAKCALMGTQSILWAWGKRPAIVAEEFDYGREHGFGWSMIAGAKKPVFDSTDYGSIAMYVARTDVSGS